jgi:thiosulfate/3-mercaptopyruvate sulfurtransferase
MQVVAYDDAGGGMAAARLWWMLRWLGHNTVAVLDGGWGKWLTEGRPVKSGLESRPRREFQPRPRPELIVGAEEVDAIRLDSAYRLLDARAAERYHGRNETIDPVAGHIPGAVSAPYQDNLNLEGVFRPAEELRQLYQELLGETPPERAIFYCGSGVTALHDLLAMLHAGLGEGRLYAGSWSEWITDPARPVTV